MPKEIVDVGSRLAQKEVTYRRLQLSMQVCFAGLGWAGLGWAGLGWAGLGWAGLGWAGLGWGMVCVLWRSHGFCQYMQQGYRYPCICLYV
jgi:hypothetical protein